MFERFTERARQVVFLAQEEARLLKHNYIGTEHILLGLLREEEGLAARVVGSFGITVERAREEIVRIVGTGEEVTSGAIPFTPRAKKVCELALREALSLGHNYIGTEHILLGLVRENEGIAARVLLGFRADSQTVRTEVIRMLEGPEGEQWRLAGKATFADPLTEGSERLIRELAREIEAQLGRPADAGDLLLALAFADGVAARTLARLDVDPDSLSRAAEKARQEGTASFAPAELRAEIARVRAEKEAKIVAQEFEEAAALRDAERELTTEARKHEDRQRQHNRNEVRRHLGLADQ